MSGKSRPLGPWALGKQLGQGGNATVYRATRDDWDRPVALKVIWGARSSRVYGRFANEVKILRNLDGEPGVLPLLDAHVPRTPTDADPPWLAMPEATLISEALADAGKPIVVEATCEIASTLARLADSHDLGVVPKHVRQ